MPGRGTLSVGVCLRGLATLKSSVPVFMLSPACSGHAGLHHDQPAAAEGPSRGGRQPGGGRRGAWRGTACCWAQPAPAWWQQHETTALAVGLCSCIETMACRVPALSPLAGPPRNPYPRCAQFRARLWLFVSFLIAAGAVAGSVAVLISATQQADLAGMGVVSGARAWEGFVAGLLVAAQEE